MRAPSKVLRRSIRAVLLGAVLCAAPPAGAWPENPPVFLFGFAPGGHAPGHLSDHRGLAVGTNGHVYVADTNEDRIQVFDRDGRFLRAWAGSGLLPGQLQLPHDLALDAQNNVYVADTFNRRIQVFTAGGELLRIFHRELYDFGLINGIDVENGQVFALDATRDRVYIMDLFGGGPSPVQPGYFSVPYPGDAQALAVSGDSDIYVLSLHHATVTKFNWRGERVLEWGAPGRGPGEFDAPERIETDTAGNVYVAERANFRVQKFDANGTLLTLWGTAGDSPGQFGYISSLAASADGRIYVGQFTDRSTQFGIQVFVPAVGVVPMTWSGVKERYR
jgi:DNA-binding beta-propeller fold protein YncE